MIPLLILAGICAVVIALARRNDARPRGRSHERIIGGPGPDASGFYADGAAGWHHHTGPHHAHGDGGGDSGGDGGGGDGGGGD